MSQSTMTPPPTTTKPAFTNPVSTKQRTDARRKRTIMTAGILGGVVALVGLTVLAIRGGGIGGGGEPPLNADTVTLVKFITTTEYSRLPFARQALFMKVLEDREDNDELEKAFEANQLTEPQYRAALLEAWLGEQLKRSEKYHTQPSEAARARYIKELLDQKEKKKADKGKPSKSSGGNNSGQGDGNKDSDEIKRDDSLEQIRIDAWPADARAKWVAFKDAYAKEKAAREQAAAGATSR